MKPNAHLTRTAIRVRATLAAFVIAAMFSSCAHLNPPEPEPEPEPTVAEKKPPPEPIKPPPPSPLYEWWGKNEYLSHVEVSINEQKARFYSGDKLVGWTTVASGIHKYPTPTGKFTISEKVQNKKSNLYGKIYSKNGKLVRRGAKMGVHKIPAGGSFRGAPMPYFLRLTNDGIGMHAGPIPRPGNRASHGCIRMPKNFAPILYRHVDIGTPVTIKGNGPAYASYLAKQRKSAAKRTTTSVAKAKPSQAKTADVASAAAAPMPAPADEQAAIARGAGETPPVPTADAALPSTPTSTPTTAPTPPASGMTGMSVGVSAQEAPPSIPTAESTPPTPEMVSAPSSAQAPAAPAAPRAGVQVLPTTSSSGMTGVPAALPGQAAPTPSPAPPSPSASNAPRQSQSAPAAGMTSAPSVPVSSAEQQSVRAEPPTSPPAATTPED